MVAVFVCERGDDVNDLQLIQRIGRGFIWVGAAACGIHFLLALPGVGSFSGFLLTLADTISRLAGTVGLGAVLLTLAEVAETLRARSAEREVGPRP